MRSTHTTTFLAILLAACAQPETGIDRTVLSGTLTIPPIDIEEGESTAGSNDGWQEGVAVDLGPHSYRYTRLDGEIASFAADAADVDSYRITPLVDGTMPLTLTWDGAGVFQVDVLSTVEFDDLGEPTVLSTSTTDGSGGTYSADLTVTANTGYVVQITGLEGDGAAGYQIVFDAFDPNETTAYIGAWENADPADRGLLLGGTSVTEFELDEETLTWSGEWTLLDIRSVVTEEVGATDAEAKDIVVDSGDTGSGDTGDSGGSDGTDGSDGSDGTDGTDGSDGSEEDDPIEKVTVNEAIDTVYLHAGTFAGLTGSAGPGVLYATEVVEVSLKTNETGEDIVKDIPLSMDDLLPIPLGWTTIEAEPNDIEINDEYAVIAGEAQALPIASGPGLVDVIRATMVFEVDDPQWSQADTDGYTITVDQPLTAMITMAWDNEEANLDLNLNDGAGELIAVGWDPEDVNPEVIDSAYYEVTFQPGEDYTLLVLPWSGPAGDLPYTISIEWFAAP